MQSDLLRIDVPQVHAVASRWSRHGAHLATTPQPPAGHPGQPTTVAVGQAHAAVHLAAAGLTARIQATSAAVTAGVAGYVATEATAAADVAALRPQWV